MIVGAVTQTAPPGLHVMQLAARHGEWSATRAAVIAGNIANADTPGFRARDIETFSFEDAVHRLQLAATKPGHMSLSDVELRAADVDETETWDLTHSSNTVSIDEELMKADETARDHQLSTSVLGAFHRMLLTSVSFR